MSGEFRLRFAYRKSGRLRFLSHLEVVRAMERSIRRAGLPYAVTKGFSPKMKVAFGPALPVGTASEREYLDVWLARYTTTEEALRRLADATPEDLAPTAARYVGSREPSLGAAATIAPYRVTLQAKGVGPHQVQAAFEDAVEKKTLAVEHKGKQKVFDLTRSLPKEVRVTSAGDVLVVEMTIRMGAEGSLRPEVLTAAALSEAGLDAAVMAVTRTDTLIETEEGVWSRPV